MPIFLDSGNLVEIDKFFQMGIIRGVTSNPTILLKEGVTGGMKGIKQRSVEIAKMISPYPLSVEVTTNDKKQMIEQAQEFAQWAENINVKITIHGPEGRVRKSRSHPRTGDQIRYSDQYHRDDERPAMLFGSHGRGYLCVDFWGPGQQYGIQLRAQRFASFGLCLTVSV